MIKGYASSYDYDRLKAVHPTLQPLAVNRIGLDVISNLGYFRAGTDTIDSFGSDGFTITAAAHVARVGDIIRFTSGNAIYIETRVMAITTNTISIADTFLARNTAIAAYTPSAGDTFLILRPRAIEVDEATGSVVTAPISTGPIQFTLNGATQTVIEDTAVMDNNRALPVKIINDVSETIYHDYASSPVTTAAWTQLVAATAEQTVKVQVFDSSGELLEIGTGAAAAEVRKFVVTPGGNGVIDVRIPAGTRLSIRAVTANASVGFLAVNVIRE